MKTLVCTRPGLLEYASAPPPKPAIGQAIIKIRRIGVCGTDLHAFEGTQPYFNYPRILGHELSGELMEADNRLGFEQGEPVTFNPYFNCGHCVACRSNKPNCCVDIKVCGVHVDGGMVEYLAVPSSALIRGRGLTLDELAMVELLSIGTHGVERAKVTAGEFVLIMGAGPIGLGTMEFAKIAGAHVIAIDINDNRLAFCQNKLGIPHTINGATDNVLNRLKMITNGEMPQVIIDATGNLKAILSGFNYLAHGGRYLLIGLQRENICFSHPEFHKREATLMSSRNATHADFQRVITAIQQKLVHPLEYITHNIAFDQVKGNFQKWLDPKSGVIKAMITI